MLSAYGVTMTLKFKVMLYPSDIPVQILSYTWNIYILYALCMSQPLMNI